MKTRIAGFTGLLLGLALCQGIARADSDRSYAAARPLPLYAQECGSCHLAFPPALLPAASWQHILQGLDRHYGVDATLEAADIRALGQWLTQQAAPRAAPPPEDRITRSRWFVREHREISASTWKKRPAVQCQACHAGAGQGLFDDD